MNYTVNGIGPKKERTTVVVEAETEEEAKERARELGYYPLSVAAGGRKSVAAKLNDGEIAFIADKLSMFFDMGIGVPETLGFLKNAPRPAVRLAAEKIAAHENKGGFQEMVSASGLFPPFFVGAVTAGSKGADLPNALSKISDFYEFRAQRRETLIGLLGMPVVVILFTVAYAFYVVTVSLPNTGKLLTDVNVVPTGSLAFLLPISKMALDSVPLLAGAVVLGLVVLYRQRAKIISLIESGLNFLPAGREMNTMMLNGVVAQTMSMLVRGGASLEAVAKMVRVVVGDCRLGREMDAAIIEINQRGDFAEAIGKCCRSLDREFVFAIRMGQRTNQLGDLLVKAQAGYRKATEKAMKKTAGQMNMLTMVFGGGTLILVMLLDMWLKSEAMQKVQDALSH